MTIFHKRYVARLRFELATPGLAQPTALPGLASKAVVYKTVNLNQRPWYLWCYSVNNEMRFYIAVNNISVTFRHSCQRHNSVKTKMRLRQNGTLLDRRRDKCPPLYYRQPCSALFEAEEQLRLVTRKPVFGVSNQVRLKPACSADGTSYGVEI